ncbi:nitroreductase family protein [Propionispora vibrioides]|jgi:nitroreductase|uniref:Nitroreductase n=1 Tax=Propionispora vibrioides TaxID=112903 RepID=A0A1H8NI24_9FIRM|nr:nitroreductase family protein [Propionispora vibrioides]SEO29257.1 Nitroreductase [Propionispora vibrioides]
MTEEIFECMRESKTVRNFRQDPITDESLAKLIEAACWAPSAGNLQPWFFYVVKNEKVKQRLAAVCTDQPQVAEAPVAIVVMADPAKSNEKYGERGAQLYCLQDTAAAAENLLLAAESMGLATCWVGSFDEPQVQKLVEAPPRLRAVAIICVGYSDQQISSPKERLRVAEVTKIIH